MDALSCIVHSSRAFEVGKKLCLKLKDVIPKHLFEVAIQVRAERERERVCVCVYLCMCVCVYLPGDILAT